MTGLVSSITYFSKNSIQIDSLKKIVGMHSNYLNTMKDRYNDLLVTNLPEFFNQMWANALWHDEFQNFRHSLDKWLNARDDIKYMDQTLRDQLENTKLLGQEDFIGAYKSISKDTKEWIKDQTVAWLNKNKNHLPM